MQLRELLVGHCLLDPKLGAEGLLWRAEFRKISDFDFFNKLLIAFCHRQPHHVRHDSEHNHEAN